MSNERKRRVAVYSGSFNPIHIGHLAIANYVIEFGGVDEVWFLVSPQNPLKSADDLLPERMRLEWVRKSIEGEERMKASDFEFHLPRPSYTIDTLRALREAYPGFDFVLMIGADNWEIIDRWRDYQTLISEFGLIVYPRLGHAILISEEDRSRVEVIKAPVIEVSSTFIRQSFLKGRSVGFFLPEAIREEVKEVLDQFGS